MLEQRPIILVIITYTYNNRIKLSYVNIREMSPFKSYYNFIFKGVKESRKMFLRVKE